MRHLELMRANRLEDAADRKLAAETLAMLKNAYKVLYNPTRRAEYDRAHPVAPDPPDDPTQSRPQPVLNRFRNPRPGWLSDTFRP